MNEHWDVRIVNHESNLCVDVKSRKKISRAASTAQDTWVWIELHSVRPDDAGWLYGYADLVAFERLHDFVLVERERLIRLVEELVPPTAPFASYAAAARYKLYGREGRSDILTQIEMRHIEVIAWAIWNK